MSGRPAAAVLASLVGLALLIPRGTNVEHPLIEIAADNPNQPYGIVAINFHFHDAHPTLPLATTRTVTWTNDGSVTHNVTIPTIGFSKDIPVGGEIEIADLGEKLGGPGIYTFYCQYHVNLGMRGTIIIK